MNEIVTEAFKNELIQGITITWETYGVRIKVKLNRLLSAQTAGDEISTTGADLTIAGDAMAERLTRLVSNAVDAAKFELQKLKPLFEVAGVSDD